MDHLLGIINHSLYGALVGLLVAKLGDDSLFPDRAPGTQKQQASEQVPQNLSLVPQPASIAPAFKLRRRLLRS